jgi:hypothetical protein
MPWLQNLDVILFRFINQTLSNPLFDAVMPWMSGNRMFLQLTLLVAAGLIWRGRGRAVLFLLLLALTLGVTDGLLGNPLKQALGRVRPCGVLEQVHVLVGCSGSASMPSNPSPESVYHQIESSPAGFSVIFSTLGSAL